MPVIELLRKANRFFKRRRAQQMARLLSPVRRIERVAPSRVRRLVAMTFDDGPSAGELRPGPARGLTETLIDVLGRHKARGTFDVIGTTAHNYPDREGRLHTAQWSGVRHDHYPEFGRDQLAGVANQPELARRLVAEGHELANHTYHHVAFGRSRWVYGSREYLPSLKAVIDDLTRMHRLVEETCGYTMRLARPPHFIDRTVDGYTSYDAYRALGYQYLAASFDGGGWKPTSGSYERDVELMVGAVRAALEEDEGSLNGQIIFQKDGYNMSRQTPVADALPRQLELLSQHGYEVVTVSDLLAYSPVHDLSPEDELAPAVRGLLAAGYTIAFRDNSVQAARPVTRGELAVMSLPPHTGLADPAHPAYPDCPRYHPYYREIETARILGTVAEVAGNRFSPDDPASGDDVVNAAVALLRRLLHGRTESRAPIEELERQLSAIRREPAATRAQAIRALWAAVNTQ